MDKIEKVSVTSCKQPHQIENLQINRHKKSVKASLNGISFIDDDTKSQIFYLPSFDVSGYGETLEEAQAMAFDALRDLFDAIVDAPNDQMLQTLKGLGWLKSPFFNKQFSKTFIDSDGKLQGFNIQENSLKTVGLIAA